MMKIKCLCLECEGVITDPVCVSCFEKQIFILIKEKEISQSTKKKIREEIAVITPVSFSNIKCVICHHKVEEICRQCLTKQTSVIIENYLSPEEIGQISY